MVIRKATEKDLNRIMEIYARARKYMADTGNPNQWGLNNWPPEELIKEDIRIGKSYVCAEDTKVIGVFFYDYGADIENTYKDIEGQWVGSSNYGVVHRLASDGSRKGIGEFCIRWALRQHGHLRIDTHGDNKTMQNLLMKMGFHKCGIIYVTQDPYPRIAYEKMK